MKLSVKMDTRELDIYLSNANDKGLRKAVARSLNRTATTARKLVASQVSRSLGGKIGLGKIKAAMPHMRKARASEAIDTQQEHIGGEVKGLSLNLFGAKQTSRGVTFTVGGRKLTSTHSFLRKANGAKKGTAFRLLRHRIDQPKMVRKHGEPELPIEKSTYKSIIKQMQENKKVELVNKIIDERFVKELQGNVSYLLLGNRG